MKVIGASFSQLITATMISRLVINLRSAGVVRLREDSDFHRSAYMGFVSRTIGNLGEELDTIFESSIRYSSTFTEGLSTVKTNHQSVNVAGPS